MDLKKYICAVETLEKEKYSLEGTINQIDSIINQLRVPPKVYRSANNISEEETKMSCGGVIVLLVCIFLVKLRNLLYVNFTKIF